MNYWFKCSPQRVHSTKRDHKRRTGTKNPNIASIHRNQAKTCKVVCALTVYNNEFADNLSLTCGMKSFSNWPQIPNAIWFCMWTYCHAILPDGCNTFKTIKFSIVSDQSPKHLKFLTLICIVFYWIAIKLNTLREFLTIIWHSGGIGV